MAPAHHGQSLNFAWFALPTVVQGLDAEFDLHLVPPSSLNASARTSRLLVATDSELLRRRLPLSYLTKSGRLQVIAARRNALVTTR